MEETRRGLKLPLAIENEYSPQSVEDKTEIGKAVARANGEKYKQKPIEKNTSTLNKTLLRSDSSELTVITYAKKLSAYIMTVTQKSPKHFLFTFVNRLQNYCLDHYQISNSLKNINLHIIAPFMSTNLKNALLKPCPTSTA